MKDALITIGFLVVAYAIVMAYMVWVVPAVIDFIDGVYDWARYKYLDRRQERRERKNLDEVPE
jgi:hypothetical protein